MKFRWTIKELNEFSNKRIILALIVERKSSCTNVYAPFYKRLSKLEEWVKENITE